MADEHLSWRKPHTSTSASTQTSIGRDNDLNIASNTPKDIESWRGRGPAAKSGSLASQDNFFLSSSKVQDDDGAASQVPRELRSGKSSADSGPAAPLNPLQIGHTKPLPHPTTYPGSDNWALTPTGSLPSLPGTPSRAMNSMGWQHIVLPGEEHRREGSGSRELSAARALLNRRNEETTGSQMRTLSSATQVIPRQSPRPLQPSSPSAAAPALKSPSTTGFPLFPVRPISPPDVASYTSTPPRSNFTSPRLRHRDSTNSDASSSLASLGVHHLSHSRRASQVFANLSATSIGSPVGSGPAYRVYRPPHLRGKDSIHALKPKVAHYDRVRTPSLRGQSRSPDPSGFSSRLLREDGSTPEASVMGRSMGRRRLSSLGSFNSTMYDEPNGSSRGGLDSRSLYAKLVANKSRKLSDASSYRPDESLDSLSFGDEEEVVPRVQDDFDLTVEDLMGDNFSLTDEFCLSRTASVSDNQAVVDIFQIGDRLGPGLKHDGLEVTIAETSEGFKDQSADLTGSQLEVVKKLGEGSYAVVYLVKEVARGTKSSVESSEKVIDGMEIPNGDATSREGEIGDETVLGTYEDYGTTLKASNSGHLAKQEEEEPVYFALKCLCKRDLSDEMLKVQRLEATIHQSIPQHPCIVTLYRTYETAEWLFLILEYCPGQDLFYWLEQASDTTDLGAETPLGEALDDVDKTVIDATPPSPSLLASTGSRFLLSTRRLRLISRMFQQMCQAVDFCHQRGISHRDIKPENFIVEDTRKTASNDSIKVKLTDFGLAVAQEQCIDFDCGSKPYMSYECRNNRTRWYDPRQADIWSLGIVLLNLIFHRNPFAEPNADQCPSFASYVEDPVHFLVTAFRGLTEEAAEFLAENVFCDVTEGMDEVIGPKRRRINATEFGQWASNLSNYMESPSRHNREMFLREAGADVTVTSPLWSSRSPTSSLTSSLRGASPKPSMLRSSTSIHREKEDLNIPQEEKEHDVPASSKKDPISHVVEEAGLHSQIQPSSAPANIPKRKGKRGSRRSRSLTKQDAKRSHSISSDNSRSPIHYETNTSLIHHQTGTTWRAEGKREVQRSLSSEPPTSELYSGSYSSDAASDGKWVIQYPNSKRPSHLDTTGTGLSSSDVAANWRERAKSTVTSNVSNISTVPYSSLDTSKMHHPQTISPPTTAFSHSNKMPNNRGILSTATNLHTIKEKAARPLKSGTGYLADIFGGTQSGTRMREKSTGAKPIYGHHHARDAGIKNGALAAALSAHASSSPPKVINPVTVTTGVHKESHHQLFLRHAGEDRRNADTGAQLTERR